MTTTHSGWWLLGLALAGCGSATARDTTTAGAPGDVPSNSNGGEAPADVHPRLLVVRDADTTLYLFGTVHALPSDAEWLTPRIREPLQASRAVYFEVPTDPAAMTPYLDLVRSLGLNPGGQALSSLVPEPTRTRFVAACQRSRAVPCQQLELMRPWLAGVTLTMTSLAEQGVSSSAGADGTLETEARRAHAEVRYLETIDAQLHALGDLPFDVQVQMLDESLDEASNTAESFERLVAAWQRGDATALYDELVRPMHDSYPVVYEALLVARNRAWVDTLAALAAREPGTFFIAAGSAHFVGPDAVQEGLRARGLEVHEAP